MSESVVEIESVSLQICVRICSVLAKHRISFCNWIYWDFPWKTNPFTGLSFFETFVVPILLYGCETWILSDSHFITLESFQAEVGKRILDISI